MTQLVLHTGTPTTRVRDVQASLAAWRQPLADAGVVLLEQDRLESWDSTVQQVIAGETPAPVRKLLRQSAKAEARMVLLSSEAAYRPLRKGKNLAQLTNLASSVGVTARVVLTLREQLGMLNSLYCRQVVTLESAGAFEPLVHRAIESGAYNYARTFRALLDSDDIELVAIPFSKLGVDEPARDVLREAGVPNDVVQSLPRLEKNDPLRDDGDVAVGPVLLAAIRLLQKRLVRLELTKNRRPVALKRAVGRLESHAVEGGWDSATYWGWSPDLGEATAAGFQHSNAEFAAGAWRTDWPDPVESRPYAKVDIVDLSPTVVVDVVDAIQQTVNELTSRNAAAAERL